MIHSISDVLNDYKQGKMVILVDDCNRENEGDLVVAAEHATAKMINFMATWGRGLICLPMLPSLAQKLNFHSMVDKSSCPLGTAFTVSVDAKKGTTTGISAFDRAETIKQIIDPASSAADFIRPGHLFPLVSHEGGLKARQGHTEASVDMSLKSGLQGAAVICEIMNDDGTMARLNDLELFSIKHNIKIGTIEELAQMDSRLIKNCSQSVLKEVQL